MTVPARRGSHGHFLPGVSGNPGGRTSALTEVRALLKPHVALYVERLNQLVRDPDPGVALPALREALDRLLGKAVVAVEQDVRTLDVSETIRQMWLQVVQQNPEPLTIDAVRDAERSGDNAASQTMPPPCGDNVTDEMEPW
jgi:hypothetical protein